MSDLRPPIVLLPDEAAALLAAPTREARRQVLADIDARVARGETVRDPDVVTARTGTRASTAEMAEMHMAADRVADRWRGAAATASTTTPTTTTTPGTERDEQRAAADRVAAAWQTTTRK